MCQKKQTRYPVILLTTVLDQIQFVCFYFGGGGHYIFLEKLHLWINFLIVMFFLRAVEQPFKAPHIHVNIKNFID